MPNTLHQFESMHLCVCFSLSLIELQTNCNSLTRKKSNKKECNHLQSIFTTYFLLLLIFPPFLHFVLFWTHLSGFVGFNAYFAWDISVLNNDPYNVLALLNFYWVSKFEFWFFFPHWIPGLLQSLNIFSKLRNGCVLFLT